MHQTRFYPLKHSVVIDSADAIYMFEDLEFIEDRITRGVFKLQDESGCFWPRPGTGVFPGDTGATLLFVRSFSQPVMQHVADQFCTHGWHVAVEARLPWDEHGVDARQIALAGFVDDIANKVLEIGKGGAIQQLAAGSAAENEAVSGGMGEVGAVQN
eukprot:1127836-Pyramimonas_sp.AAC.1